MSDAPSSTPAPSGPASASDTQLTGRFAEERNAGYREMPERKPQPAAAEREFSTGREAADALAKKRRKQNHAAPETRPVQYQDERGRAAPKNETVTLERAADDLKVSRITDASAKEINDRDDLARDVDNLRAKAGVPTDPTYTDQTQIDPRVFGDPRSHLQPQQPQIEQHIQPAPPGIDPDLHLAFQNPKIRNAVEKEVNTATLTAQTAQAHYAENVQVAQEIALGSINAAFPEMAGIRTQGQMQQLLNHLQQTNPQRAQQAQQMLQNFARLHAERGNMERQKQQIERQHFQRESSLQDAAFAKSLAHVPAQQRESVAREAISYAQSLGISEQVLTHLLNTNPIMRHSAFRKMMYDAAAGSLARKQLEAQRQQNRSHVPYVQRPGSGVPGTTAQSANLQALSQKLNVTGGAREAADLLIAMRSQRRR
jgi:hypothetical protein